MTRSSDNIPFKDILIFLKKSVRDVERFSVSQHIFQSRIFYDLLTVIAIDGIYTFVE
jgi:hypothetical protein